MSKTKAEQTIAQDLQSIAQDVLYREAFFLDERRWDDWLSLYNKDAEYWIPAWKNEDEITNDPNSEISLIYIDTRRSLEERVERARSGRSAASKVLPRTAHLVANVLLDKISTSKRIVVNSNCTTQIFDPKRCQAHQSFARYCHELVFGRESWVISKKKIMLLNDTLPAMLDFYTI